MVFIQLIHVLNVQYYMSVYACFLWPRSRKGSTASSDAGAAGQAGGHVNACGGCHRSQSSCFCQGPGEHPAMEAWWLLTSHCYHGPGGGTPGNRNRTVTGQLLLWRTGVLEQALFFLLWKLDYYYIFLSRHKIHLIIIFFYPGTCFWFLFCFFPEMVWTFMKGMSCGMSVFMAGLIMSIVVSSFFVSFLWLILEKCTDIEDCMHLGHPDRELPKLGMTKMFMLKLSWTLYIGYDFNVRLCVTLALLSLAVATLVSFLWVIEASQRSSDDRMRYSNAQSYSVLQWWLLIAHCVSTEIGTTAAKGNC